MAGVLKHNKWLQTARKLLPLSNHKQYRIAVVLVRGGRIISYGVNNTGSAHAWVRRLSPWSIGRHAEVMCVVGRRSLEGSTIYLAGDSVRTGFAINTRPCSICQTILKKAGVSTVVFQDGEAVGVFSLR